MEVIALQSGSSGNCIFVEAGDRQLLFDAGISGVQAEARLAAHGRDIRDIDALIISHDHRDHAVSMGIYQRKYGLPIYITRATLAVASEKIKVGRLNDVRHFEAGSTFALGDVQIQTIPTPHDAADGVVFVIDDGHHKVGILTDLGHAFDELMKFCHSWMRFSSRATMTLRCLLAAFIPKAWCRESVVRKDTFQIMMPPNYCGVRHLKNWWVCLAHLSEESNTPELAIETPKVLGDRFPVYCASRDSATPPLRL